MTVRRLVPEDVALFRAVRLEALREEPQAYASRHDDWAALPEEEWRARLTRCATFADFDGEEAVGLIGVLPRDAATGEVVMVYLRRSHRGSGRAAALMAAALGAARVAGLQKLQLRVATGNMPGFRFYSREGFTATGQEDAGATLVMQRLLA